MKPTEHTKVADMQLRSEEPAKSPIESPTKRESLKKLLLGGVALAVFGVLTPEANAKSNVPDPAYDKYKAILAAKYNSEAVSEKLTPDGMRLMDHATQVMFRLYGQRSFGWHLIAQGKKNKARKAMEIAMSRDNREKFLSYTAGKNGYITITKKHGFAPDSVPNDFKIVIRDGMIVQINDMEIDYRRIGRFEKESRENERNIEESVRIVRYRYFEADDNDRSEYQYFTMELPRLWHKLLQLKGYRSPHEQKVFNELNRQLIDHPKDFKDSFGNSKPIQFYTTRRQRATETDENGEVKVIQEATPKGIYELVHAANQSRTSKTFAAFSNRGFVMKKINGKWIQSDHRKQPFKAMCEETYETMKP